MIFFSYGTYYLKLDPQLVGAPAQLDVLEQLYKAIWLVIRTPRDPEELPVTGQEKRLAFDIAISPVMLPEEREDKYVAGLAIVRDQLTDVIGKKRADSVLDLAVKHLDELSDDPQEAARQLKALIGAS